ncbi:MAG TPA: glycosyltransferase family 4 protein [Vicinamibacterales bacterium]|nr:glycosyltransferase family 4 protein [Vicinamibacterales bacterium]
MRIVHLTPHLPPDQAANALLPYQLGEWAAARGDTVLYVAHPPRAGASAALPGDVTWVPRRQPSVWQKTVRVGSFAAAARIWRAAAPRIASADVVHIHSNGLLAEVGASIALRLGKPYVLTLYGTEIWHYQARRGLDLFTRAYRGAAAVVFYSERLLLRARELALGRFDCHVIYPPVSASFTFHDWVGQQEERLKLGISARHLIVNVKRLHPLAGQHVLIEAMGEIVREHPDARLVICGTGERLRDLQHGARAAGVERHVVFAGLVDNTMVARYCAAADLFALPSLLEALPTVAVEALAAGTPVVSSDNPGGLELNDLFGRDVEIVPRENALALADAIRAGLRDKRRTTPATGKIVSERFRADTVARQYWDVYDAIRRR